MNTKREYYTCIDECDIRNATSEEIKTYEEEEILIENINQKIEKLEKEITDLKSSKEGFKLNRTYFWRDCYPYDELVFLTHSEIR